VSGVEGVGSGRCREGEIERGKGEGGQRKGDLDQKERLKGI